MEIMDSPPGGELRVCHVFQSSLGLSWAFLGVKSMRNSISSPLIPSGYPADTHQVSWRKKGQKGGQVFGKTLMPSLLEDAQNHWQYCPSVHFRTHGWAFLRWYSLMRGPYKGNALNPGRCLVSTLHLTSTRLELNNPCGCACWEVRSSDALCTDQLSTLFPRPPPLMGVEQVNPMVNL